MSIIEKAVDKMMGKLEHAAPADAPDARNNAMPAASDEPAAHPGPVTEEHTDEAAVARGAAPYRPTEIPAEMPATDANAPATSTGTEAPEFRVKNELSIRSLGLEGILLPDSERSRTAEEYRMIKRPLLTRAFGHNAVGEAHRNLIMLTSSVEGEGKTFTSLNLAISIAMEMDRTVLLADADLAKPGLSRVLKINNLPGLTDRLIDDSLDLRDLLIKTDIPKFSVLPAGRRHRRSTELLASNTMRQLLDELALRYSDRVVLFDSPP